MRNIELRIQKKKLFTYEHKAFHVSNRKANVKSTAGIPNGEWQVPSLNDNPNVVSSSMLQLPDLDGLELQRGLAASDQRIA
jgi:hypothetical protein